LAASYVILGQIIRSSAEAAAFQKNKLKELSIKDFPFSDSHDFIKALKLINEEIISVFDGFRKEFDMLQSQGTVDNTSDYSELQHSVILHTTLIWYFNMVIHYVEQTAREYVSQSTVYLVSYLTQQFASRRLFAWDSITSDEAKNLIDFFKLRLGVQLDNPRIEKTSNGKAIRITSGDNTIDILLDDVRKKAILLINDHRVYEFISKEENGKSVIYSGNVIFLLTPTDKHNFEYTDIIGSTLKHVVQVFPNVQKILDLLPENVAVLSFPDIYRDNIVANILLAHEVGHFIINVRNLIPSIFDEVDFDEQMFEDYVNTVATSEVEGTKGQKKILDYIQAEKLRTILKTSVVRSIRGWIEELLCDMIGFKLSGPVFVFGLGELLLSSANHSVATNDYPSAAHRLKLILSEVDRLNFAGQVSDHDARAKLTRLLAGLRSYLTTPSPTQGNIFDKTLPSTFKNQEKLFEIVSKAVESVQDKIKSVADEVTEGMQYSASTFGRDIGILLKKLEETIPPCETEKGKPADIISILNAGIMYKMTWKDSGKFESSTKENIQDVEKDINALVLHSIEASVLQRELLNHLEKGK